MTVDEFRASLPHTTPPAAISPALEALWYAAKGDWNKAHAMVQDLHHPFAYWIHAFLHRKEPDLMNASYWYSRAKKPMPDSSYNQEWKEISDFIKNAEM